MNEGNNNKSYFVTVGALGIFILFSIYSLTLQLSAREFVTKSIDLNLGEIELKPKRGNFYDRNGVPLTGSENIYSISIDKTNFDDEKIAKLANFIIENKLNFTSNDKVIDDLNNKDLQTVTLNDFTEAQEKLFKDNYAADSFYSVSFDTRRTYNYPLQTTHLIGYEGKVSQEDIDNGYAPDDFIGKYKLEAQYENELKGTKGKKYYVGDVEVQENPEPGDDITLTIDNNLQQLLYRLLQKHNEENNAAGGGGVVIDDSNGEVVALASYPGINTNDFLTGISTEDYDKLITDRSAPFNDKAIGTADAPGSIFKIITAFDLLENKVIDKDSYFFSNRCLDLGGGYNFCEYGKLSYGNMNVERALYKSSNMFFCNFLLAQNANSGFTPFKNSANLFSIGSKTNIDLIGETAGNMDSPEYRKDFLNLTWFDGDTCNTAIGQGAVLVTPIQMAMVASAIANKGVYYQPHILKDIQDVYKNVVKQTEPIVAKQIPISDETLRLINSGMSQVANNPEGTVYYFLNNLPGNIRAKTGTAETYENIDGQEIYRTHGWIVGTYDYNGKSYSFAFHLRYGGGGFLIGNLLKEYVRCVYANDAPGCDA
ncbi:MAG: penicillin-binding transpeptidase domain-containing protein [Candidatus Dojkabacteria bacterium]